MKKILVRTLHLYSDGSYEEVLPSTTPTTGSSLEDKISQIEASITLDEIFNSVATSRRIQFNIAVYIMAREFYKRGQRANAIDIAIKLVAAHQKVTHQTVVDKAYRQLSLSSSEYRRLVDEAINHNSKELQKILLENVGRATVNGDVELIHKYLD